MKDHLWKILTKDYGVHEFCFISWCWWCLRCSSQIQSLGHSLSTPVLLAPCITQQTCLMPMNLTKATFVWKLLALSAGRQICFTMMNLVKWRLFTSYWHWMLEKLLALSASRQTCFMPMIDKNNIIDACIQATSTAAATNFTPTHQTNWRLKFSMWWCRNPSLDQSDAIVSRLAQNS